LGSETLSQKKKKKKERKRKEKRQSKTKQQQKSKGIILYSKVSEAPFVEAACWAFEEDYGAHTQP
jgi:hypothetical protein